MELIIGMVFGFLEYCSNCGSCIGTAFHNYCSFCGAKFLDGKE